jgi:hypothetical protein
VHKSLLLFQRNAKKRNCDKKSSGARELQQEASRKVAFFPVVIAEKYPRTFAYISFDMYSLADGALRSNGSPASADTIAMFVSKLPPKPNFDMLAAAAPASADRRTFVLALIGNLICSWSNNESLFIYVLMILQRTDEASPQWYSRH